MNEQRSISGVALPVSLIFSGATFALFPEIASANVLDNFGDAILGILNSTFLTSLLNHF